MQLNWAGWERKKLSKVRGHVIFAVKLNVEGLASWHLLPTNVDSIDGRIFQPSGLVYMIINLRSASSVRTKYESRFCKKCVLSGAPQSKLLFNENKEKNHQLIGAAIKKKPNIVSDFFLQDLYS